MLIYVKTPVYSIGKVFAVGIMFCMLFLVHTTNMRSVLSASILSMVVSKAQACVLRAGHPNLPNLNMRSSHMCTETFLQFQGGVLSELSACRAYLNSYILLGLHCVLIYKKCFRKMTQKADKITENKLPKYNISKSTSETLA